MKRNVSVKRSVTSQCSMGSGCSSPTKTSVVEWTSATLSDYASSALTSDDAKKAITTWIVDNGAFASGMLSLIQSTMVDVTGTQLLDMEASMVLSAANIKEPDDVAQVTKLMADLRTSVDNDKCPEIVASLKDLPAALEKAVYVYEKYPLIVDETGQAAQFFKYQRGCFLMAGSPNDMAAATLRRSLVAALRHGTIMTICFDKLAGLELDQFFDDTWFPSQVVDRHELFKPEVWTPLLRPAEGDPDPSMFLPNDAFKFAILCGNIEPPPRTLARIHEDTVAATLGLKEVVRNSVQLVEAGFDGDIEALKALLDKGYHLESEDGHKHTALSEAACQGHEEVLEWLLSLGANPNALNDAGRSPLYRAAYNGHSSVITLLLKAGADPRLT
ncbi:unnamed protein product [Aphanomyces euteiches]